MLPPPITPPMSLHSKSLCKNNAIASGGANNMHPLSGGGGAQKEKIPNFYTHIEHYPGEGLL